MNHALLIVFFNALLLSAGILTVLVSCLQYANWFPILTIVVNMIAVLQLMMCGSCSGYQESHSFMGESDGRAVAIQVSWMMFGLLIITGYAVPGLLFRAQLVPDVALYFSWIGGTIILAAMIIYLRLIWNRESE